MNVEIKKGDPARLEDYVDVMRDSSLFSHYFAPDEQILRNTLADALERGVLLTAENSSGEAIALMICEWKGMFGAWPYLALLGVKKNYRAMGIGHQMLETFEKISRALGARNIFICVSAFNPRARALYTSFGFKKIALIPGMVVNGIDENMLMKRLQD